MRIENIGHAICPNSPLVTFCFCSAFGDLHSTKNNASAKMCTDNQRISNCQLGLSADLNLQFHSCNLRT